MTLTIGFSEAQLLGIGAVDVVGAPNDPATGKPKQIKLAMDSGKGPLRSWPLGFDLVDIAQGATGKLTAQTDRPAFLHSIVIAPGVVVGGGGTMAPLEPLVVVTDIVINGQRCFIGNGPQGSNSGTPAGAFRPRGFLPSYYGQLTDTGRAVLTVYNGGDIDLHNCNAMAYALCAG